MFRFLRLTCIVVFWTILISIFFDVIKYVEIKKLLVFENIQIFDSTSKYQEKVMIFQQGLLGITKICVQMNFYGCIFTQNRSTYQKFFIGDGQSIRQYFYYANRAYISDIISRGLSVVYKFNYNCNVRKILDFIGLDTVDRNISSVSYLHRLFRNAYNFPSKYNNCNGRNYWNPRDNAIEAVTLFVLYFIFGVTGGVFFDEWRSTGRFIFLLPTLFFWGLSGFFIYFLVS